MTEKCNMDTDDITELLLTLPDSEPEYDNDCSWSDTDDDSDNGDNIPSENKCF